MSKINSQAKIIKQQSALIDELTKALEEMCDVTDDKVARKRTRALLAKVKK